MASQSAKHIVPSIRINGTYQVPRFQDCIVHTLLSGSKSVEVICCLFDDKLMIAPVYDSKSLSIVDQGTTKVHKFGPLPLEHSPLCPMYEMKMDDLQQISLPDADINVAVAVILESTDSHVLLTQRSDKLRSYPGVWVPPGGHLDKGETIVECGLRELVEETGLKVQHSNIKTHYLCMWEAVNPPFLAKGDPLSHSIIVYLHVQMPYTWKELQPKLNVNQDEVQAWCWVSKTNVIQLQRNQDDKILVYRPGSGGTKSEASEATLFGLFNASYFWSQGLVYSGTQQSLIHWCRKSSKL